MNPHPTDAIPGKVLLFSGHLLDAPGREKPRFPADKEALAKEAITGSLAQLHAGPLDLAVCSGACGGDLLFAEAALDRHIALEIYLPFEPATFASRSVNFAGGNWPARFEAVCAAARLHLMPDERRPSAPGDDPYERNNLWMLDAASRFGTDKVAFVCLWDGLSGDGPGGTEHMMRQVRRRQGVVHWLDTTRLWG